MVLLMQFYDRTPGTIVKGSSVPDLSGSGHHGTMSANAKFIRSSALGQAVGLYVNAGGIRIRNTPSLRLRGPLTLEIWAKPRKLNRGYVVLLPGSYGMPKYVHGYFKIYIIRNAKFANGVGYWDLDLHYFVLMITPNKNKIYIDGRLVYSGKFTSFSTFFLKKYFITTL